MNYERINWENSPSTDTPLDADNLNKMDEGLDTLNREVQKTRADLAKVEESTDVLSARMSTFTRLQEGSTTGDAEIADARTGADGTTYDNLGDAIRGQVNNILNAVFSRTSSGGIGEYVYKGGVLYKRKKNATWPATTPEPPNSEYYDVVILTQDIEAIVNTFAQQFYQGNTYSAGDYVVYGGSLFKFNSDYSGDDWDDADVTMVDIGSELKSKADQNELDTAISSVNERLGDLDERVEALEAGGSVSGLTDDIRVALLQLASKVAYIDEQGQDYYDDLYDALYAVTAIYLDARSIMLTSIGSTQQLIATTTPPGGAVTWASSDTSIATVSNTGLVTSVGYGSCTVTASSGSVSASCAVAVSQVTLTSISADYQQSGTVYDTASLESLKSDLTVTATYSDSSTATVTEYTLSGTLTAGTSTITVSYGGKTTTFNVTVTAAPTLSSISAVYTQSGTVYDTDSLDSLKGDLVVTAHYSDSTTQTVTEYTLSGALTVGTSTITVTYGGKTDTFDVTVKNINYYRSLAAGSLAPVQQGRIVSVDNIPTITHKSPSGVLNDFYTINILEGITPFNEREQESTGAVTVSGYYPIPVPADATQAVISVDSPSIKVNGNIRSLTDGVYTIIGNSQTQEGSITFTFESASNLYFVGQIREVGSYAVNDIVVEFS